LRARATESIFDASTLVVTLIEMFIRGSHETEPLS